jgi:hypothetical protein
MWTITAFGAEGTKLPGAEQYMRCTAVGAFLVKAHKEPDEQEFYRDQLEHYIRFTAWFYVDSPERFQDDLDKTIESISIGLENGELSTDAFVEEVGECGGLLGGTMGRFHRCMQDKKPTPGAREACTKSALGLQELKQN